MILDHDELLDALSEHYRIDDKTGCWNWTGGCIKKVPSVSFKGRTFTAPRMMYFAHGHYIPDKHIVVRLCGNRLCVNPSHCVDISPSEFTDAAEILTLMHEGGPEACRMFVRILDSARSTSN